LTNEEYDALDEYYTNNPPKLSGNGKSGFFARHAEKGNTLILQMIFCQLAAYKSRSYPYHSP